MQPPDFVPADPGAQRTALIIWLVAAVLGTIAVWWLSAYLDTLTDLARTDRDAAVALFTSRVLPAFALVVLVGVIAGAMLARQGLQVLRSGEFPPAGMRVFRDTPRRRGVAAKGIGWFLATAGVVLALVPLMILSVVLWVLWS